MNKPLYIWITIYKDTETIWGVFSTRKKAARALAAWGRDWTDEFYIVVYQLDYRSPKDAIKFASDNIPAVDRAAADGDRTTAQLTLSGRQLSSDGKDGGSGDT